jgi:diaminopimelate epimerase
MGVPRFTPGEIPFEVHGSQGPAEKYTLELPGTNPQNAEHSDDAGGPRQVEIGVVSMGNPHAVLQVPDIEAAPVAEIGPQIEAHPRFPQRTNVGFMQVVDTMHINLRVYERGVGETQACGTGACAAVVIGRKWRLLDERVSVNLPGGDLTIGWAGEGQPVYMTGPAETVFEGRISL